jgi:hypothetical protein
VIGNGRVNSNANLIGGRVNTADLHGSFAVHFGVSSPFGPNSLVLTDFSTELVPEPSTGLLAAVVTISLARRRRVPTQHAGEGRGRG